MNLEGKRITVWALVGLFLMAPAMGLIAEFKIRLENEGEVE